MKRCNQGTLTTGSLFLIGFIAMPRLSNRRFRQSNCKVIIRYSGRIIQPILACLVASGKLELPTVYLLREAGLV